MRCLFQRFTSACAQGAGSPWAFIASLIVIILWAAVGPIFDWNDTWQLICNTATTIITFWLVFIIQSSQNKDTKALHAKIDELIHATEGARDDLIGAERRDERKVEKQRR